MAELVCGKYTLSLKRPLIMGIVNLTSDSFSGDGIADSLQSAVAHAYKQLEAGADILDLGAESTRPGAIPATAEQELERLLPVLEQIRGCGVPISVDTYKPAVMAAVLKAGADMINDINALEDPAAMGIVKDSNCAICLMHMRGQPRTMQQDPVYGNVVAEVRDYLSRRVSVCQQAGIADSRIVLDPGFGFGKTLEHNLSLLRELTFLSDAGWPVLVGVSRKSMLGSITGRPVDSRLAASVVAAVLASQRGASILRVHDVAETKDALSVWSAIERRGNN